MTATQPLVRINRYVATPVITDTRQLQVYQPGQWVKLAWCDKPSRLVSWTPAHTTAFHYPGASARFASYCRARKDGEARIAANRAAREAAAKISR